MASRGARKKVDVSVIIVNYNVREYLANALRSVAHALKGIPSEIIVVDNASSDGSADMVRKRFPRVTLIASRENLGFGRANNLAMQRARGRFYFLLNPDTIIQEDTVRVLVDYCRRTPRAGLAGCTILNPDGTFQLAARRSFPTPWVAFARMTGLSRLFPGSRLFGRYNLTYLPTDRSYPVDAVSGSCMFVRREVVDAVGGFDEAFFMYGEDLDWCTRIRRAGWEVHFVHQTSIVHFKGESTRRSTIDEIGTFYDAMRVFVEKHFGSPGPTLLFLKGGIRFASAAATVSAYARRLWPAAVDTVVVVVSLLAAEYLRQGEVLSFPTYAYPAVYVVPPLLLVGSLIAAGVYAHRWMSVSRSLIGVVVSFVILSALTAFFKAYAFSRAMVLTSGALCAVLVPGWRVVFRALAGRSAAGRSTVFGRRIVVVGRGPEAEAVARKVRGRAAEGFELIGLVRPTGAEEETEQESVRVVGRTETLGKVVREFRISDVIVAPRALTNAGLLTLIARMRGLPVTFHVVADSMEYLVGKASVESLADIPTVEISYNIARPLARFAKRSFDVAVALAGLITVYPFVYWMRRKRFHDGVIVRHLPKVLSGGMSMVGPPADMVGRFGHSLYVGRPGATGLAQLYDDGGLTDEEREQLVLRYARNQSLLLDVEILLKHLIMRTRRPAAPAGR